MDLGPQLVKFHRVVSGSYGDADLDALDERTSQAEEHSNRVAGWVDGLRTQVGETRHMPITFARGRDLPHHLVHQYLGEMQGHADIAAHAVGLIADDISENGRFMSTQDLNRRLGEAMEIQGDLGVTLHRRARALGREA